jgi:cytochrome c-type biogenesis protein CcmH
MVLWILIAVLTLSALAVAFWPAFLRSDNDEADENRVADFEHDIAVYKDQLAELDAEQTRGIFSQDDAAQARIEIARRLLAAEEKRDSGKNRTRASQQRVLGTRILAAVAFVFVPGLSLLMYTSLGSPTIEAQPLAARLQAIKEAETASNEQDKQLVQLVARAESHLKENPQDGKGWDVLAPVYFRLGQGPESADAYRNAIRLLGENAQRLSGLGEVLSAMAGGVVTVDADALFKRAVALEPSNGRALYYLGLGNAQAGRTDAAARQWNAIVNNDTVDGSWRVAAAQSMARLARENTLALPGPDEQAIKDAEQMGEDDRQAMIAGMVEQLDSRLQGNAGTVEEWQRLIRARMVLGQEDEAIAALERATSAFESDPQKQAQIHTFAEKLGLKAKQ